MIERKLKPPPGYVGFRRILCGRGYAQRPPPVKKEKTKFQQFADFVMSLKGAFTTCDLGNIDKKRANFYLKQLIEAGKVRLLPGRIKVPGIKKGMNGYEVVSE